jgi:hypothetical protein
VVRIYGRFVDKFSVQETSTTKPTIRQDKPAVEPRILLRLKGLES